MTTTADPDRTANRPHGASSRGPDRDHRRVAAAEATTGSSFYRRMLGNIPVFQATHDELIALAKHMQENAAHDPGPQPAPGSRWGRPSQPPSPPGEGAASGMPAGYTYFGQFIDHDVTFDPTSQLDRAVDPARLVNFRTPRLDLDSVYGRGPADDPFLYRQEPDGSRIKLLIGRNEHGDLDLPRNSEGTALTGDPRNDENTFVSQLHLQLLRFHNAVVDHVADTEGLTGSVLFKRAHQLVRWHYQWVIAHDYLRRVTGPDLHALLLTRDGGREEAHRRHYRPQVTAYMPVEFSAAAFRFGHSQVRGTYRINSTVPELPVFRRGAGDAQDFRGFRPLPARWTADWALFFDLDDDRPPQPSRLIDDQLSDGLFQLPGHGDGDGDEETLAALNLLRGLTLQLPSGQDVARALGEEPLTSAQLQPWPGGPAPLWFYILKEAEILGQGAHLGPVGGRIVGETLLGLLEVDPLSYLSVQPTWTPTLPTSDGDPAEAFDIVDLLRFAERTDAPQD